MILLVTAFYAEAKPFIEQFHMKKISAVTRFQVFEGETHVDERTVLIITGNGKVKAAAAVSWVLTMVTLKDNTCLACENSEQIFLVNIGIAGRAGKHLDGAVYCHTIIDSGSGRRFYPDLSEHPFAEGAVKTYDYAVTHENTKPEMLSDRSEALFIDMEASGIYEAGSLFLSPHQMAFLKIESDGLEGENVASEQVERLVAGNMVQITEWLCEIQAKRHSEKLYQYECSVRQEEAARLAEQVCKNLKFSVTMKAVLGKQLSFAACLGETVWQSVKELLKIYCGQEYGCSSKKEGKAVYEQLLKRIQEIFDTADLKIGKSANSQNSDYDEEYDKKALINTQSTNKACEMQKKGQQMFKHIYIEETLRGSSEALRILERYPNSRTIEIKHFKDVFNRTHQNFARQKQSPALILAEKSGALVYEGAPVCQNFGNAHFYYTSCMMNCLYECEYCYLQGMYPCGYVVAFINLGDIFTEVTELLKKHPVYLCVSFDTDLLAMESIFEYGKKWCEFADGKSDLIIEIRTKGTAAYFLKEMQGKSIPSNVILAWTLSPQAVISSYEHYTASLQSRISSVKQAVSLGFSVRLCFDPLLRIPNFKEEYQKLLEQVFSQIPSEKVRDVSIGVFRISQDYLKRMRRNRPYSAVVQYPYRIEEKVAHYGKEESVQMMEWMRLAVSEYIENERIFLWE